MIKQLGHALRITPTRDEKARQEFVAALRSHVLGDMATYMRRRYHERYGAGEPEAQNGTEVHEVMQADSYFRFYSSIRLNAQEMVFRSVVPLVDRELDDLNAQAA